MALSPQFLDELRGRLGLVEVISRRVKLQRKGREHAGLCPFHSEKTPSFWVNEEKGFFHCFGCGAHGDVIGFVMRSESLSFPEAVERLAAEAGLAVPQSSPQERARAEKAKTLATALESACAFYETQLQGGAGREALDYLRRRVIFPIADGRGRIVAFGGRVLGEGTPKYLNSREGELFHKGRMLYGLAHARRGAAEEGRLVVVEGYMDVIALHQAGFGIAVAPLGTALTEAQLGELWRLVDEPILCFDGDAAGQRAAARAAERALPLLKPGKSLRFVTLPAGGDPDTLIQRQGVAAMREILEGARPLIDLVWELEVAAHPADTPERRARFEERIAAVAKRIQDPKIRDSYAWDLRQRYWQRFRRGAKAKGRAAAPPGPPAGLLGPRDVEILELRCYQGLLAALINHPALLDGLEEAVASLVPPLVPANRDLDNLRQAILKTWAAQPDIDSGALENHLKGLGFRGVLDRILVKEVYVAAPFAHPARAIEAAAEEWRHSYALLLQRGARLDQDEAERELAEDVTEESLTRFDARRRQRASDLERARIIDREETPDSKLG